MKKSFLFVAFVCAFFCSFSAPTITAVRSGNWASANTWSLNRLPRSGDTVVIPRNCSIVINQNQNHSQDDLFLRIEGVLMLQNGKLQMSSNSFVSVTDELATVIPDKNNPSNKISIGGVERYSGHEGTVYGPSYLSGTVPTFTLVAPAALPVKYVGFSVVRTGSGAQVQWSTSEEVNASHYDVERSNDGISWSSIAQIRAAGNSHVLNHYQYQDATPVSRIAYYRIRQVDVDGRFSYTSVKSVTALATTANVNISTTATSHVLIQFSQLIKTPVQVRIVSLSGQVVAQQEYKTTGSQIILSGSGAPRGAYIVCLTDGGNLKVAKQVML